ncbi:MAG: peptide chain release factor-like protein [Deltaproteobacteria bacterium CG11_big_fil_rev_8_21_14_0_20_49_13]|nr:MAG: peptide chain release factor-like protein [Deltaproteobacteria bacterium CG11_big_fil_rev_8_21_14_0_20_49_13]
MLVSTGKLLELANRMEAVGLKEADISEHFIRASGAGGQKVDKTSSCVVLKHIPTGLEVKCQIERSQSLNRFLARRILLEKLEKRCYGAQSAEEQRIWKIRKQKKRRSKKAKEKMLANKRHHAEKKALRQKHRLAVD